MKFSNGPLAIAALFATVSLVSCTDDNQIKELREQQRLILAKLNTVEEKIDKASARAQASQRPPSTGPEAGRAYDIPAGNSPTKGPADAPITIIEFSDYQCPFCSKAEPLVKEALDAYPTKARVVFKHFPLTSIHPNAMPAALAAAAAQKQGKFWEMHEKLFANQRELSPEQIKKYAAEVGLDVAKFEADSQSDEVKQQVQQDMQLAQKVGVRGTPTIFVNGKILQTRSLDGFKQMIDPVLKEASAAPAGAQPKGS
jgi:protein-disulfide isomerase